MSPNPQQFLHTALGSAIALALTACGSSATVVGSSLSTPTSTTTATTATTATTTTAKSNVAGTVADGYLVGAKVCLDLNRDKACGSDEPSATTGAGGSYTLDVPTSIDSAKYPVVVEVSESTIDEDDGQPVGKPYVLSAPPGKPAFVSPLTTMIQTTLEQNPNMSVEEAETELKANMGVTGTVSLFKDYVKEKENGQATDDYKRIHTIAQVVAAALEDNMGEVKDAAVSAGLDPNKVFDKIVNLVINNVIEQLSTITQSVDERQPGETAPPKVPIKVDRSDIKKDIDDLDRAAKIAASAMQDILKGGINNYEAGTECEHDGTTTVCGWSIEHHRIGLADDGAHLKEQSQQFDVASKTWTELLAREDGESGFALGPNGWIDISGAGAMPVAFNDDDTATVTQVPGLDEMKVKGAVLDIGGQPLQGFLPIGNPEWFTDGKFSPGAKVYKWTFTQLHDLYRIHAWSEGETCHDGKPVADFGGNCNTVWGYGSLASKAPAASLADLVYAVKPTWSERLPSLYLGESLRAVLAGDPTDLGKGGVVRFKEYTPIDDSNTLREEAEITNEARWQLKTVHGQQVIEFQVPPYLLEKASNVQDSPNVILAVHSGWVRLGSHTPKGSVQNDPSWNYNDAASEDLKAHLDTKANFDVEPPVNNPGSNNGTGESK